ncbi:DUF805 domain-containing protein [Candidatus Planktophila versatilis]|uniref:DUF805 domain-containing protein n=1 Tax=Candidatus Planktophila versatilis TaxID=1884905 RepID=UPI000BAC9251|nr:DUF805 domain-containing protein [Candidatus Planktophila versatilis]ASY26187.1 DUF805 domain-containing protein [Candidatus Planktophila versatilis]
MFNQIGNSLTKYVDFQGKSTRKEFWSFFLFFYVVTFIAGGLDGLYGTEFIGAFAFVALILPYLAVAVRRMNDVGKSGWFILVPFYNLILALSPTRSEKTSHDY